MYLTLTAAAPITHRWWRRSGVVSLAVLAAGALAVDAVRYTLDPTAVGYLNFLFVWGAVHQLGYWWADRDGAAFAIEPGTTAWWLTRPVWVAAPRPGG